MHVDPNLRSFPFDQGSSAFDRAARPGRPVRVAGAAFLLAALAFSASVIVVPPPLIRVAEAAQPASSPAAEIERLSTHIAATWKMPLPTARRIVEAAFSQARERGLSPTLVLAIVAQESGFRPTARSVRGAQGLMQVMARHHPDKVRGLRHDALLRPETNIEVGTKVLAEYLDDHNGRVDPALRRYSGNAAAYSRKVRGFWASLEKVRQAEQASA